MSMASRSKKKLVRRGGVKKAKTKTKSKGTRVVMRKGPIRFNVSDVVKLGDELMGTPPPVIPPLPRGDGNGTATAYGWSYWSAYAACPRLWWLKYGARLQAPDTDGSFDTRNLGSLYHAHLLGNWTPTVLQLQKDRPDLDAQAKEYAEARKAIAASGGAPLKIDDVIEIEKTYEVPGIPDFTTQPDVVEGIIGMGATRVRDFKTASRFGPGDATGYEANAQILAEMLGAGVEQATVDVLVKTKEPRVELVNVRLDPVKVDMLKQDMRDARETLLLRWGAVHQSVGSTTPEKAFPPRLASCAGKFGRPCDYFNYCHGSEATKLQYTATVTP